MRHFYSFGLQHGSTFCHFFWSSVFLWLSAWSSFLSTTLYFFLSAWLMRPSVGFGCFTYAPPGQEMWNKLSLCVTPQTKFASYKRDWTQIDEPPPTLALGACIRTRMVEIRMAAILTVASFLTEAHLSGILMAHIGTSTKLTAGGILPPPVLRGNNEVI